MDNGPLRRIIRPPPPDSERPRAADRRRLARILWQVLTVAEVRPLPPPTVPEDLTQLPLLLKIYECLRIALLDLEYALAPQGHIRGILRLLIRLVVLVDACLLALAAVLAGVTAVAAVGAALGAQLAALARHCLLALLALLGGIAVLLAALGLLTTAARLLLRNRLGPGP